MKACKVESVAFDIDFRSKVTRSSFENACADLKDRFSRPILDALNNAGLTMVCALVNAFLSPFSLCQRMRLHP